MIVYIISIIFFSLVLFSAYKVKSFKRKGFDNIVHYVEYQPPKGLTIVELGYLLDGSFNARDFLSLVISFYKEGLIFFSKNKNYLFSYKYEVLLNKKSKDSLLFQKYKELFSQNLFNNEMSFMLDVPEKYLYEVQKNTENKLSELGYLKRGVVFKKTKTIFMTIFFIICFIFFIFKNPFSLEINMIIDLSFFFFISIFVVFFKKGTNFSQKGLKAKREIVGFKDYLEKVEKPRAEFLLKELHTPEERIEKIPHLEYLITFGLISIKDILS